MTTTQAIVLTHEEAEHIRQGRSPGARYYDIACQIAPDAFTLGRAKAVCALGIRLREGQPLDLAGVVIEPEEAEQAHAFFERQPPSFTAQCPCGCACAVNMRLIDGQCDTCGGQSFRTAGAPQRSASPGERAIWREVVTGGRMSAEPLRSYWVASAGQRRGERRTAPELLHLLGWSPVTQ